jgi:hypothetical protein
MSVTVVSSRTLAVLPKSITELKKLTNGTGHYFLSPEQAST